MTLPVTTSLTLTHTDTKECEPLLSHLLQIFDEENQEVNIICLICGASAAQEMDEQDEYQEVYLEHTKTCEMALMKMKLERN